MGHLDNSLLVLHHILLSVLACILDVEQVDNSAFERCYSSALEPIKSLKKDKSINMDKDIFCFIPFDIFAGVQSHTLAFQQECNLVWAYSGILF